ncbi:MAG: SMC-Scp complex subunit ScpB [Porticoccus sp.]|nr:SMC-Scp complex subunit ScpB [Porticoccus sp.]
MESNQLKMIIEGALLAAGRSLDINQLERLFDEDLFGKNGVVNGGLKKDQSGKEAGESETSHGEPRPPRDQIQAALEDIASDCKGRAFELKKTGSGYRFQVRNEFSEWINRLWEEKPKKYSRALLETLALIAYRQPITRGDIEEIRGVSVSSETVKTLLERDWVRVVGHRDVPGRPALYATTKQFLDYFSLKNLEDLPALNDIKDIEEINPELALEVAQQMVATAGVAADEEISSAEIHLNDDSGDLVELPVVVPGLFQTENSAKEHFEEEHSRLEESPLASSQSDDAQQEPSQPQDGTHNQMIQDHPET